MKKSDFTYLLIPLGAFLFLLWFLFKKKKPNVDDYKPSGFTYNGQQATISEGKAYAVAENLKDEFAKLNSDEDYIFNLFQGMNEADYLLVYQQFGTQKHFFGTGTNIPLLPSSDLTTWIVFIMNNKELARFKNQFPSIF